MKFRNATLLPVCCATVIAGAVMADDTAFKLEELTCFDVISQAEEDSLFLIALLIGHSSGVTGNTEMSGEMLEATIENIDTVCGENPEMLAIDVLNPR